MSLRPILFDVDGVLADFIGKCLDYINLRDGIHLTHEDVSGDIRLTPYWGDDCDALVRSPGFCRDLKPFPEGVKAVESLKSQGEKIIFVTSPFGEAPTWCHDRQKWLESYFGVSRDDVIFARSKQYVDGLVLIDDLYRNVIDWTEYGKLCGLERTALLFNQPTNKKTPMDPYPYNRVETADQIIEIVKQSIYENS